MISAQKATHRKKPTSKKRSRTDSAQQFHAEDEEPLSSAEIKELERRARDSRNPVRYMLVSEFSRRFILYYNVSEDVFAMNNPIAGTLFKRREAAKRVKTLLGRAISIIKFSTKDGELKRLSPYRVARTRAQS